MNRILLEEDSKPNRQLQRCLNPSMMNMVKKEILKLLDVGVLFNFRQHMGESGTSGAKKN